MTTSTLDTTSGSSSAESDASQGPAPTFTPQGRVTLPKRVAAPATSTASDDVPAPWVLLDVAIAGTTAITGVVLVRKGRVPFG